LINIGDKLSIDELFYYLTEAVEVRYSDLTKYVNPHYRLKKAELRDSLFEFIKELEQVYKNYILITE